jgi:hypothetical protein
MLSKYIFCSQRMLVTNFVRVRRKSLSLFTGACCLLTLFTMTSSTPSIINILTLLVCMLPVAARSPFGRRNKLSSLPKTVFQHPLAEANHRNLQTTDEQVCEFLLNQGFIEEDRQFCGCERSGDIYQVECRFTDCPDCEILQELETCAVLIEGVDLDAETLSEEVFISCVDYESGLFDSTICVFEESGSDNCTVTVNDVSCDSCAFTLCDDGFEDYSVDCSNVPGVGVWNFCTADIPETSPFVSFGDNNLFFFDECFDFSASPSPGNFNSNSPMEVSSSALSTGPTASPQTAPSTASPQTTPLTTSAPPSRAPVTTAAPSRTPAVTVAPSRAPATAFPSSAPVTVAPSSAPVTAAPSKSAAPSTSAAPSRAPVTAVPSTTTSSTPSTQPSTVPSDTPSMVPSTPPSTVPSDTPSLVPSTRPSTVPSDTPSRVPSTAPSIASLPDVNRSPASGGFHLSIHTLLLVVSAAFVATVC